MLLNLKQCTVIIVLLATISIIVVQFGYYRSSSVPTIIQDKLTHGHGEVLLLDKALNLPNKPNSTLPTTQNDGAEQQRNGSTDDRATKASTDLNDKNNVDEVRKNKTNHRITNSSVHLVFLRPTWVALPTKGETRVDSCDVPCFYSGDNSPEVIRRSSAVIFLLHNLKTSDPDVILKNRGVDPTGVIKVGMSMESTIYYRQKFDLISKYDIELSYRKTSDVYAIYYGFPAQRKLLKPVPKWGERHSAAVFVANNCQSSQSAL